MKVYELINMLKQLPEMSELTLGMTMEDGEIRDIAVMQLPEYVDELRESFMTFYFID